MALSRKHVVGATAGGVAILLVGVALAGRALTEPEGKGGCRAFEPERSSVPPSEPLELVEPGEELVIDLGAGRERRIDSVDVVTAGDIPDNWDGFRVNVSTLSFAGRRELQGDGLVAVARRVSRTEIEVTLCIDPTAVDIAAGRYQGKVRFDDPRLDDLEIEAIVYAQQTTAWVWIVLAVLAGLAASLVAYSLHGSDDESPGPRTPSQWLPILLVIAAGFGAAFTQTVRTYTANRSWGSDGFDGLILAGQAIALAYGATVATTDIVRAMERNRSRPNAPAPQPTPQEEG